MNFIEALIRKADESNTPEGFALWGGIIVFLPVLAIAGVFLLALIAALIILP